MRMSREATAESKERIVAAAARLLRERGIEGASVADVMHAAGMTHGGFYKHFESKEALAEAAMRAAFEEFAARFDAREAQAGWPAAVQAYVDDYLSQGHIENPGLGCPVAAIGAEAGRRPETLAPAFAQGAEALVERLTPAAPAASGEARAQAIRRLAMLVGAVVVARAVGPGPLREEVRAAVSRG